MLQKTENIKVKGHRGTWYLPEGEEFQGFYKGERVYELEHEEYGDEAPHIIVNEKLEVILEDVWNGFLDLYELEDRSGDLIY